MRTKLWYKNSCGCETEKRVDECAKKKKGESCSVMDEYDELDYSCIECRSKVKT